MEALKTMLKSKVFVNLSLFVLAFFTAYFVQFAPEALAVTLIDGGDSPTGITGATQGEFRIRQLILTFTDFFLGFLGLLAVLMVIYGGFLYLTAAGDDSKVENGKKIIMYSIVGIVIILISFALIHTVITGLGQGQDL